MLNWNGDLDEALLERSAAAESWGRSELVALAAALEVLRDCPGQSEASREGPGVAV